MPSTVQWENFLHGELNAMIEREHAPGGAILLMSADGELQYEQAMGLARVETADPLHLDTPIRAGSISKVVTAIAVQQLVERGKLDLDSPIEALIDWNLPYGYGRATTRDLLTHRAGIGERFANQSTSRAEEILALDQYLKETLPPPVAPMGETVTYSNLGISLAGLIVERVSGQSFAEYARQEIFLPMEMNTATFVSSSDNERMMARGYNWIFGSHRLLPNRYWKCYPASSLVASPRELAALMHTLLQESSPILERPAALYEEQFTAVPGVPGMGLVFWLDKMRGERIAWHTGHMPGHRTGFYLFPDSALGVVFYYNTDRYCLRTFLERTATFAFGKAPEISSAMEGTWPSPTTYRDTYRHCWYPHHHFGKNSALLDNDGGEVKIRAESGNLVARGVRLKPLQNEVFSSLDGVKRLGFIRNARGRITGFYTGGRDRFERISFFETRLASLVALVTCLTAFEGYGAFVLWEIIRGGGTLPDPMEFGLFLACGANTAFGIFIVLLAMRGVYKIMENPSRMLGCVLALPIVGLLIWILSLGFALAMPYQETEGRVTSDSFIVLLSVAELLFITYLHYWRLLGWRY